MVIATTSRFAIMAWSAAVGLRRVWRRLTDNLDLAEVAELADALDSKSNELSGS